MARRVPLRHGELREVRQMIARLAARYLASLRHRKAKPDYRAVARQLREECGLPPSPALGGC